MSQYLDAIGYLDELRNEINNNWFTKICELAISAKNSSLNQIEQESLLEIFEGRIPIPKSGITSHNINFTVSGLISTSQPGFLKSIAEFKNFKKLSDTLSMSLTQPITIIFGTNGSGKSSLCEALKILASPDRPANPTANVGTLSMVRPSFTYTFDDGKSIQWNEEKGYGNYSSKIKYFDSFLALKYIQDPLKPKQVVELSPFHLHIFEYARDFTVALRDIIELKLNTQRTSLNIEIENIRLTLLDRHNNINDELLPPFNVEDFDKLTKLYIENQDFNEQELLINKKNELNRLEKLQSEEGLQLLKNELEKLKSWRKLVDNFYQKAKDVSISKLRSIQQDIEKKKDFQREISLSLTPNDTSFEKFKLFLNSLDDIFDMSNQRKTVCPVCKQDLNDKAWGILKQYKAILNSKTEEEIKELQILLNGIWSKFLILRQFNVSNLKKEVQGISPEIIQRVRNIIAKIKRIIPSKLILFKHTDDSRFNEIISLNEIVLSIDQEIEKRRAEIFPSTVEKVDNVLLIKELEKEIQRLEFKKNILDNSHKISILLDKLTQFNKLNQMYTTANFTQLLKKITTVSKKAQTELIIEEFTSALDKEYYALSEKHISDFAVKLPLKGSEAEITMTASVGGNPINKVLSEGEQRLHALALFFSELNFQKQKIVVFDDPVSSFDYNYTEGVANRIRDFLKANSSTQIIIFTHNWEFFVQIQFVLKRAYYTNKMSVMVLENCSIIEEYQEDLVQLKEKITGWLLEPGEPSKERKQQIAGNMRRLIEVLINTHVFNGERHQYKQKSMKLSVFEKYTHVTPLKEEEAIKLKDLYSKLSISEHDDPRNAYVNDDKLIIQNRFDDILNIENDITTRKWS